MRQPLGRAISGGYLVLKSHAVPLQLSQHICVLAVKLCDLLTVEVQKLLVCVCMLRKRVRECVCLRRSSCADSLDLQPCKYRGGVTETEMRHDVIMCVEVYDCCYKIAAAVVFDSVIIHSRATSKSRRAPAMDGVCAGALRSSATTTVALGWRHRGAYPSQRVLFLRQCAEITCPVFFYILNVSLAVAESPRPYSPDEGYQRKRIGRQPAYPDKN